MIYLFNYEVSTNEVIIIDSFRQLSTIGIDRTYIQNRLRKATSFIHVKRNLKFELI